MSATKAIPMLFEFAQYCWAVGPPTSAPAKSMKKIGKTATMMVVCTAEMAQSYIAQARSSGRWRPSLSSIRGIGAKELSAIGDRLCDDAGRSGAGDSQLTTPARYGHAPRALELAPHDSP